MFVEVRLVTDGVRDEQGWALAWDSQMGKIGTNGPPTANTLLFCGTIPIVTESKVSFDEFLLLGSCILLRSLVPIIVHPCPSKVERIATQERYGIRLVNITYAPLHNSVAVERRTASIEHGFPTAIDSSSLLDLE